MFLKKEKVFKSFSQKKKKKKKLLSLHALLQIYYVTVKKNRLHAISTLQTTSVINNVLNEK